MEAGRGRTTSSRVLFVFSLSWIFASFAFGLRISDVSVSSCFLSGKQSIPVFDPSVGGSRKFVF